MMDEIRSRLQDVSNCVLYVVRDVGNLQRILRCPGPGECADKVPDHSGEYCLHCTRVKWPEYHNEYPATISELIRRTDALLYGLEDRVSNAEICLRSGYLQLCKQKVSPANVCGQRASCYHSAAAKWATSRLAKLIEITGPPPRLEPPVLETSLDPRLEEFCRGIASIVDAGGEYLERWSETTGKVDVEIIQANLEMELQESMRVAASANQATSVGGLADYLDHPYAKVVKEVLDAVGGPQNRQASTVDSSEAQTAHSCDFRSITWFGASYAFTANQSKAIQLLWEAWENGTPDVGDETLLNAVDENSPPRSLRDLFRGCDAWGTVIVEGGSKGSHRLQEPKKS